MSWIVTILALTAVGEPTVAELIAELQSSAPAQKRGLAAMQLGHRGPQAVDAVPALIAALSDKDATLRNRAAEALGGIGILAKPAIPALLERLGDDSADVRETACEALADIRAEPNKVVPAIAKLLDDEDFNVRTAAATSLGDFKTAARTQLERLKQVAQKDKHMFVRDAAAEAVRRIERAAERLGS